MMWYLPTVGSIVRCYSDSYQHQLLLEQAENLGAVYDALNYVGSCPWRVNTKVCVGVRSECGLVCLCFCLWFSWIVLGASF